MGKAEMFTGFRWGNLREIEHLEDLGKMGDNLNGSSESGKTGCGLD
jgi:hypothetical protein